MFGFRFQEGIDGSLYFAYIPPLSTDALMLLKSCVIASKAQMLAYIVTVLGNLAVTGTVLTFSGKP